MILVGLTLAVASSLALNAGYLLQHAGSAVAPMVTVRAPLASLRGLARSRVWVLGMATNLVGSVLHIGALAAAPLTLVQAFSAGGLVLVAPAAARMTRCPLDPVERVAVGAIAGSLALLAIEPATSSSPPASPGSALLFLVAVIGAAAVLATASEQFRGGALALAAGLLYGLSDAATKAFTAAAEDGLSAAVLSPWPPIIVGLCVAAFFAFQRALQLGAPAAVIVLMTAAMNVTAAAAGLAVFAESLGAHTGMALAHGLAMAGVTAASLQLVAAQTRLGERRASVRPAGVTALGAGARGSRGSGGHGTAAATPSSARKAASSCAIAPVKCAPRRAAS